MSDLARQIREQDIAPLLEARGIRRRGKTLHCLFHEDRRPSASIHKNRLHCFVCDRSWSNLDLVMEQDGLDLRGAVRHLADFYGIRVEDRPLTPTEKRAYGRRKATAEREAEMVTAWRSWGLATLRTWRNWFWRAARNADVWLHRHPEAGWEDGRTLASLRALTDCERLGDRLNEAVVTLERLSPIEVRELMGRMAQECKAA